MNIKLLAFISLLVGNIMAIANAQEPGTTPTEPVDPTTSSPFPPIIAPINWSFLKIDCVPKGKWCHYLANTTFGVALGYYLDLPFEFFHEDLIGLQAKCQLTKSSHKCSLFYHFNEPDVKPIFLARCTNHLPVKPAKPVIYCSQSLLPVDIEPVPDKPDDTTF
jgi:hypothetical protein